MTIVSKVFLASVLFHESLACFLSFSFAKVQPLCAILMRGGVHCIHIVDFLNNTFAKMFWMYHFNVTSIRKKFGNKLLIYPYWECYCIGFVVVFYNMLLLAEGLGFHIRITIGCDLDCHVFQQHRIVNRNSYNIIEIGGEINVCRDKRVFPRLDRFDAV